MDDRQYQGHMFGMFDQSERQIASEWKTRNAPSATAARKFNESQNHRAIALTRLRTGEGLMFLYFGDDTDAFAKVFGEFGVCLYQ